MPSMRAARARHFPSTVFWRTYVPADSLGPSAPDGEAPSGHTILDSLDWIVRSPRAWVIISCLTVYVRTAWGRPDPLVLGITGTAVVGAIIAHVWGERC